MRTAKINNYDPNVKKVIRPIDMESVGTLSYMVNVFTDKDKLKLIKELERMVRNSLEYKEYIEFLKNNMDMTQCSFFNNISNKNRKFSVHIHHEPFTLFDIVKIVVEKAIKNNVDINYFDLSEEVMLIHYRNMVGLLPLSLTVHEAVHDGQIFIPLQAVFGNFMKFYEEYQEYISIDDINILRRKIAMSKETTIHDFTVLVQRYVYVNDKLMDKIEITEEDSNKSW